MEKVQQVALTGKHVAVSDWRGAGRKFEDVFEVGHTVDEELVERFAGIVSPHAYGPGYFQTGDASDHTTDGEALYTTFQKVGGTWVYVGDRRSGDRVAVKDGASSRPDFVDQVIALAQQFVTDAGVTGNDLLIVDADMGKQPKSDVTPSWWAVFGRYALKRFVADTAPEDQERSFKIADNDVEIQCLNKSDYMKALNLKVLTAALGAGRADQFFADLKPRKGAIPVIVCAPKHFSVHHVPVSV